MIASSRKVVFVSVSLVIFRCCFAFAQTLPSVSSPALSPVPLLPPPEMKPEITATKWPFVNGHNVSATSDALPKGNCVLGLDIAACGVSDRISVGTSIWMLMDYNMNSLAVRGLLSEDAEGNKWALQTSYFKTYRPRNYTYDAREPLTTYQMEALWIMLIRTVSVNDHYRMHFNFHSNYYFDEKMPFSLRRPYVAQTPYQFNLTVLNELSMTEHWILLAEGGLLDFARAPLHFHVGTSVGRVTDTWSFHFGFSMTGSRDSVFAPTTRSDYQEDLRAHQPEGYNSPRDPLRVKDDFSIHPEFNLSYQF